MAAAAIKKAPQCMAALILGSWDNERDKLRYLNIRTSLRAHIQATYRPNQRNIRDFNDLDQQNMMNFIMSSQFLTSQRPAWETKPATAVTRQFAAALHWMIIDVLKKMRAGTQDQTEKLGITTGTLVPPGVKQATPELPEAQDDGNELLAALPRSLSSVSRPETFSIQMFYVDTKICKRHNNLRLMPKFVLNDVPPGIIGPYLATLPQPTLEELCKAFKRHLPAGRKLREIGAGLSSPLDDDEVNMACYPNRKWVYLIAPDEVNAYFQQCSDPSNRLFFGFLHSEYGQDRQVLDVAQPNNKPYIDIDEFIPVDPGFQPPDIKEWQDEDSEEVQMQIPKYFPRKPERYIAAIKKHQASSIRQKRLANLWQDKAKQMFKFWDQVNTSKEEVSFLNQFD